jgi:molybdate transport system substrate-binding protein
MVGGLMSYLRITIAAFAVIAAVRAGGTADAAEIRVLSSGSVKAALSQLLPDFQKSSGNTATIEYGHSPGVELAGPLPGEIQNTTLMAAGIITSSKAPDVARAFIGFISSPSAVAVLKASGFQPVN